MMIPSLSQCNRDLIGYITYSGNGGLAKDNAPYR